MHTREWTPLPKPVKLGLLNEERRKDGLPPLDRWPTKADKQKMGLTGTSKPIEPTAKQQIKRHTDEIAEATSSAPLRAALPDDTPAARTEKTTTETTDDVPKNGFRVEGVSAGGNKTIRAHAMTARRIPKMPLHGKPGKPLEAMDPELALAPSELKKGKFWLYVARSVSKAEIRNTPKAKEACDTEWAKLEKQQCWDYSSMKPYQEVKRMYADKPVHFGNLCEICVEKGHELPEGSKERKFKGRVVFLGDRVRDQWGNPAIFQELSSSPAAMEAAKFCDAYGLFEGHVCEQADGEQAYCQSLLRGTDTWIHIPYDRWLDEWKEKYPPTFELVCRLVQAH